MKNDFQLNKNRSETLEKYIKHMLLLNDPRFRFDYYYLPTIRKTSLISKHLTYIISKKHK